MIPDPFVRVQDGADGLVEGHYLVRRVRARRVDIPVRIWFGPPIDEDGQELDRSPRWQVQIAGTLLDTDPIRAGGITFDSLVSFWPGCATDPITAADYAYRLDRAEWAALYDPEDPFAEVGGKIDCMTARLPFS